MARNNDSTIESAIKNSYNYKTYLKDDDIKVEAKNGVVTLSGTVSESFHRSLAEQTAADIPGVSNVNNQLTVKGDQPSENSDAWITAKVKSALLFHKNVSATGTTVETQDGVVTLRGEADSAAQRELTAQYAKDVKGVRSVSNQMTIGKNGSPKLKSGSTVGEKIDDASITAQVKSALLFHQSTSAVNTKVTTNKGTVTLQGEAKNAAEKDLVTKIVEDIHGVKRVDNKMRVQ
ncbi:BON domain-containing protein [Geothrix sp. 21YS21S-4]|uniref:BON domain-containing protein n=1 Tax=Geothrix sp. 21YS21S-4 TaxID=3068889 RepID=UPI003594836D